MEWFDAHRSEETRQRGGDLREADYTVYWSYDLKPLAAVAEVGWIAETFPQRCGDAFFTHEWYVAIGFDDAKWFGAKAPVLSPYLVYYRDVDDFGGGRIEFQVSHVFAPADLGTAATAFLKDVYVTPSLLVSVDNRQLTGATRVAFLRWGIETTYDLSAALKLPPKSGRLGITAFLYYRDSLVDDLLQDRLYGGVSFGYAW